MPPETETNNETKTTQGQKQGNKQGQKAKPDKKEKAPPKEKKPKEPKAKPERTTTAHMAKVDKFASTLPSLSEDGQVVFTAANNLSTADMLIVVAHLQVAIRRRGITKVAEQANSDIKIEPGVRVKVVSGNAKFLGHTGTVSKTQRIRCYVKIDGKEYAERDDDRVGDYFFIADVVPLAVTTGQLATERLQKLTQPAQGLDINTIIDEAGEEATGTS